MKHRRGRGEGSIFKSDDRWVAEITLPNGKKRRKYGKTAKEVRDWLDLQKQSVKDGVVVDNKSTFKEFLDRYLSDIASTTLRPRTYESYEMNIRLHVVPVIGKVKR